ncbi:MAG: HlyC/CorC family transporter [Spirochaetales bacterium]|nr:HlyC/CorC family transporter [Spirochaetales bacterium]
MSEHTLTLALIILLLALSAFFSAAETAVTSITRTGLRRIGSRDNSAALALRRLLERRSRIITTILVGNNIVNIWASSLATALALEFIGESGILISTGVMTLCILIFGEITPKNLASKNPEGLTLAISPLLRSIEILLFPITSFFSLINRVALAISAFFGKPGESRLTEDELRMMVQAGHRDGALEEGERRLLERAVAFTGKRVREIMTARTAMAALSVDTPIEEVIAFFREQEFSRLPVYREDLDTIVGIVHYKDILFVEGDASFTLADLIREPLVVPETQRVKELFTALNKAGQNMAIVVDEHGSTAGLVTMDDALSSVIGDIHDEYDEADDHPRQRVRIIGKEKIIVPGDLLLDDLNALLKTSFDSWYYETVGGLILETAGRLPERGEVFRLGKAQFKVLSRAQRTITRVEIRLDKE